MLIHEGGGEFIFKRFMFHNMTPMTGSISNAQKNWLIFCSGTGKSLFSPGIPINWIMGMLEQVRRVFINQTIYHINTYLSGRMIFMGKSMAKVLLNKVRPSLIR